MELRRLVGWVPCLAVLLPLSSCTRIAEGHCGNTHEACAEGLYCNTCFMENHGCVDERPTTKECMPPQPGTDTNAEGSDTSGSSTASGTGTTTSSESSETGTASSSSSATSESSETSSSAGTTDSTSSSTGSGTDTMGLTDSTSDSDGGSTTGPTCPDTCPAETPICDEGTGMCRTCLDHAECEALDPNTPACRDDGLCKECTADHDDACMGSMPVCSDEPDENTCTECNADDDCMDPESARCQDHACVPCTMDEQCTHLEDTQVCHMGECVECKPGATTACTDGVCDMTTFVCTNRPAGTKVPCQACVNSDECMGNRSCVMTVFQPTGDDVDYFCLPDNTAGCGSLDPYFDEQSLVLVEGGMASMCGLALSTCPARNEFRVQDSCSDMSDDDACGVVGLDDGYCREAGAGDWRCTLPCGSDDDCPGFPCFLDAPAYCTL